ncbi:MAG TPA: hypothetical protein VN025_09625 [Candidatus Dormibacteraeota bacterium]|nr:hypothetical protein [Candidatus Dormibacteraeota bacterium]
MWEADVTAQSMNREAHLDERLMTRTLASRGGSIERTHSCKIFHRLSGASLYSTSTGTICSRGEKPHFISRCSARNVLRTRRIREEVIGHRLLCRRPGIVRRRGGDFTFAMLHQPPSQQGGSRLLDPLIHQCGHLLSQVRRVAQTGQFVGLQAVARSGQQKFPRRLHVMARHVISPE